MAICYIVFHMKDLERILKGLANKRRLAIVRYLKKGGPASVTDIAVEIKLSFKATSRHLTVLTSADILDKEQKGLQMFYRVASPLKPAAKSIINLL